MLTQSSNYLNNYWVKHWNVIVGGPFFPHMTIKWSLKWTFVNSNVAINLWHSPAVSDDTSPTITRHMNNSQSHVTAWQWCHQHLRKSVSLTSTRMIYLLLKFSDLSTSACTNIKICQRQHCKKYARIKVFTEPYSPA